VLLPTLSLEPAPTASPSDPLPADHQALLLDGRAVAATLRAEVQAQVADLQARHPVLPGLAVLVVGQDPASRSYLTMILKTCRTVGLPAELFELPATATRQMIQAEITYLNGQPSFAGIIVQMPLPEPMLPDVVTEVLDPAKDVDGIHPANAGRLALGYASRDFFQPATPLAGMELLRRYNIPVTGRRALVIGRSAVVGKPLSLMLLAANATVTIAHSRTPLATLRALAAESDIVATAVGQPGLLTGEMLRPGAVVLDFGVSVVDGALVGDADAAGVARVAGAYTPVPGGIGPITNLMLVQNTLKAARKLLRA
jgi:methylenetetrahydrofolate dehydrogenase (NADP+)/methenyltetrahydrofolate cyclohydrolase